MLSLRFIREDPRGLLFLTSLVELIVDGYELCYCIVITFETIIDDYIVL